MVHVDAHSQAQALNRAFVSLGGSEIRGLERLDARRLAELTRTLSGSDGKSSGGSASAMASAEGKKSVHTMALILSASVDPSDKAQRIMQGFCGGAANDIPVPVTVRTAVPNADAGGRGSCGAVLGRAATATTFDALAGSCCVQPGVTATVARRGCDCCATAVQPASAGDAQLQGLASYGGESGLFEDVIAALMIKVVADFQKQIEDRLQKLQDQAKAAEEAGKKKKKKKKKGGFGAVLGVVGAVAGAFVGMPQVGYMVGSAVGGAIDKNKADKQAAKDQQQAGSQESRNIEFEKIKFDMQKLSQMQQAMSNVLNTMDELAKSAIRNIKT